MFVQTKAKREQQQYEKAIQGLLRQIFGLSKEQLAEQNRTWGEWSKEFKPYWRVYIDTFHETSLAEPFKARLLAILLNPSEVAMLGEGSDGITFAALSPILQQFAFGVLRLNLSRAMAAKPGSDIHSALWNYNPFILEALALLDEKSEEAESFWHCYQLNEQTPFLNMDFCSGYGPFEELLWSPVPKRWKYLADEEMRRIICRETAGEKPRAEHERALDRYRRTVECSCSKQNSSIQKARDLLIVQIEFLLSVKELEGVGIFSSQMEHCLQLIGHEQHDLGHRLARRIVLEASENRFSIYDDESFAAAQLMLNRFGTDLQLCTRLQELLTEARAERCSTEKKRAGRAEIKKKMRTA